MTTRIVDFDPAHCVGATAHPSQAQYQTMLDDPPCFRWLWPDTLSALDGDELIAIGGATLVERMMGGWVLFTDRITPSRFVVVHRVVARFLLRFEAINDPIFAHVDPDNPNAVRWVGLLGLETRRTEVFPDNRRFLRVQRYAV